MKNFRTLFKFTTAICAIFALSLTAFADENDNGGDGDFFELNKLERAKVKDMMKKNVSKNDFGDVVINFDEKKYSEGVDQIKNINEYFLMILNYADPSFDLEKFDAYMEKITSSKKQGKKSAYRLASEKAFVKYLARKNMDFRPFAFTVNNLRLKLDEGMPVFVKIRNIEELTSISERSKERSAESKPDEWVKKLNKLECKKPKNMVKSYRGALMLGYNKNTNEYLVLSLSNKKFWISENELKILIKDAQILKM